MLFVSSAAFSQDSTYGEIKVIKPKVIVPLADTATKEPQEKPANDTRFVNPDRRYRILSHGFFAGVDYADFWSYRAGFFYSGMKASTALAFRHSWNTGYTGVVGSLQFPLSLVANKRTSFWYCIQPGLEWSSMGKSKQWYHSLSTYLAFVFPSRHKINVQARAGYHFNPNPRSAENMATNSAMAGIYFHF